MICVELTDFIKMFKDLSQYFKILNVPSFLVSLLDKTENKFHVKPPLRF